MMLAGGTRPRRPSGPVGPCAYLWGFTGNGALGIGSAARGTRPTPVRLPVGTASLAVGTDHVFAVTSNGELWAWGGNEYGRLGDGTTAARLHPVQITFPRGVRIAAAAASHDHALAISTAGQLYAWGRNHFGQVGDGTTVDRYQPVHIPVRGRVASIACGRDHTAVVTADGAAYTFGINNLGQLGDGTTTNRNTPTKVRLPGGTRLAAIDAGNDHTFALTTNGRVAVWGNPIIASAASNPHLRPTSPVTTPVVLDPRLFGGSQVVAVDGGDHHATALTRDGRLWTWGRNAHGQLGDGTGQDRRTPAVVKLPARVNALRTAGNLVVVLLTNGDVYTWGENRFGQLGDGTTKTRGVPARVDALHGAAVTDVAAGAYLAIARADRGPQTALMLQPAAATVRPNQRVSYSVHARDAFGNDLGPFHGHVTLKISDGHVSGTTVWASKVGRHSVTATADKLSGHAVLDVTEAHHGPPPPPPHHPTFPSWPGPRSFR